MRVFIAVLVLIFSLQSWTKADDISDFEIEGMSIGDSLLKYVSVDEIKKNMKLYSGSKKFSRFFKKFDYADKLVVSVNSKKIKDFINNEAYN